jgi:hypothetical protein
MFSLVINPVAPLNLPIDNKEYVQTLSRLVKFLNEYKDIISITSQTTVGSGDYTRINGVWLGIKDRRIVYGYIGVYYNITDAPDLLKDIKISVNNFNPLYRNVETKTMDDLSRYKLYELLSDVLKQMVLKFASTIKLQQSRDIDDTDFVVDFNHVYIDESNVKNFDGYYYSEQTLFNMSLDNEIFFVKKSTGYKMIVNTKTLADKLLYHVKVFKLNDTPSFDLYYNKDKITTFTSKNIFSSKKHNIIFSNFKSARVWIINDAYKKDSIVDTFDDTSLNGYLYRNPLITKRMNKLFKDDEDSAKDFKFFLVQNVSDGDLNKALSVCDIWRKEGRNVGHSIDDKYVNVSLRQEPYGVYSIKDDKFTIISGGKAYVVSLDTSKAMDLSKINVVFDTLRFVIRHDVDRYSSLMIM